MNLNHVKEMANMDIVGYSELARKEATLEGRVVALEQIVFGALKTLSGGDFDDAKSLEYLKQFMDGGNDDISSPVE